MKKCNTVQYDPCNATRYNGNLPAVSEESSKTAKLKQQIWTEVKLKETSVVHISKNIFFPKESNSIVTKQLSSMLRRQ